MKRRRVIDETKSGFGMGVGYNTISFNPNHILSFCYLCFPQCSTTDTSRIFVVASIGFVWDCWILHLRTETVFGIKRRFIDENEK